MGSIPVISFSAWSGTGKTTLIEKLITVLKERQLRIAVVKHDGHDFEIDHKGKDSRRFYEAGADITVVSSSYKTAIIEKADLSLEEIISKIKNVDLIIVEGYKGSNLPKIGLARKATQKGFTEELWGFDAIVTDMEVETHIPKFGFDDTEAIADFIMERILVDNVKDFTHFNEDGRAKMVDVGEKSITKRTAVAQAKVMLNSDTFRLIKTGGIKKGDVLTVAQIAGIMGAKKTSDLIPMCHPIMINGTDLSLSLNEDDLSVEITAEVSCDGKTGVEMEALTAASAAALTVYDMCKAIQRDIVITDICLVKKTGGIHGDYTRRSGI